MQWVMTPCVPAKKLEVSLEIPRAHESASRAPRSAARQCNVAPRPRSPTTGRVLVGVHPRAPPSAAEPGNARRRTGSLTDTMLEGGYSTGVDLTMYGFTLHVGEITGRYF